MLVSRPFRTGTPRRQSMATSGRLKSKVDRLKKKIAEKGSTLAPRTRRILTKKLKRFQRARRTALALEKRSAGKAIEDKGTPKGAEGKAPGAAPETEAS